MKTDYASVKMFTWFNIKKELDWRVDSSPAALAAFRAAMADDYFLSEYARLFNGFFINSTAFIDLGYRRSSPGCVFNLLNKGSLPNLARLVGGPQAQNGIHVKAITTAPSITFCAQTTIFTGLQPDQHGIAGNQFFDRFGETNHGKHRFYALDIGDTLAVKDAVEVFMGNGLLSQILSPAQPTLYERAAGHGMTSVVAYHMLARGSTHSISPIRWILPVSQKAGD